MDFNSKPDCLLFAARSLAAAIYCINSGRYNSSSVQNAKGLALILEPIIANEGISILMDDNLSELSAKIAWPTGDKTELPNNEPRFWADQFAQHNWERSELKRDTEKALQLLR